jgi:RNA polymerase sigma factor (sigma-70 family)
MATRTDLRERAERRARILAEVFASDRAALRRQAARSAGRREDAEDALQDACAEFLRYYEGPPGDAALRYLMVSVRRRARALCARAAAGAKAEVELASTEFLKRGEPQVAVLCERPGPAERAERRAEVAVLAAGLAALKPDERAALLLLGLGFSYAEIAAHRSWTRTKVNRCLAEGRAALRGFGDGGRDPVAEPLEG